MTLRSKLVLLAVSTSLLVAAGASAWAATVLRRSLRDEVRRHAVTLVEWLSDNVGDSLLRRDVLSAEEALVGVREGSPDLVVYAFVLDDSRQVFASTFGSKFPPALLSANPLPRHVKRGQRLLETEEGRIYDVASRPLPGLDAEVHLGVSQAAIDGPARAALTGGLLVALGLCAIAAVLALALARRVTRPLAELARAADEVQGTSDFSPPPHRELGGSDEIGTLSRALRGMAQRLTNAQRESEATAKHLAEVEKLAAAGRLLAGVAHDIKNPLTSVKTMLEGFAQEVGLLNLTQEDMAVLATEVGRMELLVNRLLDVARPAELRRDPCDPSELVRRALGVTTLECRRRHIQLEPHLPANLPLVLADPSRIEQVLVNLFLNAVDAMPQGGTLKVRNSVNGSGRLVIEVSDTGSGVSDEIRNHLFEPFQTTKERGTGLGLWVAHRIVVAHDGVIEVSSSPNGSEFRVVLPTLEGDVR